MEVSARRSATLPGWPPCAGGVYGRSSPVSLCSLRGPPGALDSDVYWPARLCCVRLQDLELTTNDPPITRTVARFSQAPAQDPLVCCSTRQCWLQLWVSCTVVPSALLWLYSEFGTDYKSPDSTRRRCNVATCNTWVNRNRMESKTVTEKRSAVWLAGCNCNYSLYDTMREVI